MSENLKKKEMLSFLLFDLKFDNDEIDELV